ncbi:CbtA family protein [Nocardioides acrostichi]|uniref:CbtA family protein n=1 Tax=Nocardioides acrostichi TaxID=2784339 RepID=A0A930UZN3_9ACTN|nr:CbtA family protein [Nocardioides acrostichi]MBF4162687.1 CbtA family protein [Nocardioides acrostichi]
MSARDLLVRGLLAGLVAGLVAFAVAATVGEPPVERAIAVESSAAHEHGTDGTTPAHDHDEEGPVSRTVQRTVGLWIATVAVGVALGGLVSIGAAFAVGRLGRLTPGQSTAVVVLVGFCAVALVPFWRYPANPPAVGEAATIGTRTAAYFGFVGVSLLAAVVAVVVGARLLGRLGAHGAVVLPTLGYLLVVGVVGSLMPAVDEVGGFPADVLWDFRTASLLVLASLWAALGVSLTWLVAALHRRHSEVAARRAWAASL